MTKQNELPAAPEAEKIVLGSILMQPSIYTDVSERLTALSFSTEGHSIIFEAISSEIEKNGSCDLVTVAQQLRAKEQLELVGGPAYLSSLTTYIGTGGNIAAHVETLAEKQTLRQLLVLGNTLQSSASKPGASVDKLLQYTEQSVMEAGEAVVQTTDDFLSDLTSEALTEIEALESGKTTGMPVGIAGLDKVFTPNPSDLIIEAGRPGMGKTSSMIAKTVNLAARNPVGIFSLEMSKQQLYFRYMANLCGIDSEKFRQGGLTQQEWADIGKAADNEILSNIVIDDSAPLTIYQLKSKARRWRKRYGVQAIFVDYLQLVLDTTDGSREEQISNVSSGLKALAKELKIPVFSFAQLSRAVETRGGLKKPILSDLRYSGAIEQDADVVVFDYWPKYYGYAEIEGENVDGYMFQIVAKNRHGKVKEVPLRFEEQHARLYDTEPVETGSTPF